MNDIAGRVRFVDLAAADPPDAAEPVDPISIRVGIARARLGDQARALVSSLDLTLTSAPPDSTAEIFVPDVEHAAAELAAAVAANPLAAATVCGLLRSTAAATVTDALVAESLAYSMLLAGPEFARWRSGRAVRAQPPGAGPAVLLTRDDDVLHVTLNRPERRNALGVAIRDGLVEAFELAAADDTIRAVRVEGSGPAFCSGGDLDEFGSAPDVATAHLIRLERSVARRVDAVRDRVTVRLHGACVGAGIEIPSFAGRVVARSDTAIWLPEVGLGLLPGAGGTVGLPRRIGRWRTAYLALTGARLDARTAADWGLVDEVDDG